MKGSARQWSLEEFQMVWREVLPSLEDTGAAWVEYERVSRGGGIAEGLKGDGMGYSRGIQEALDGSWMAWRDMRVSREGGVASGLQLCLEGGGVVLG